MVRIFISLDNNRTMQSHPRGSSLPSDVQGRSNTSQRTSCTKQLTVFLRSRQQNNTNWLIGRWLVEQSYVPHWCEHCIFLADCLHLTKIFSATIHRRWLIFLIQSLYRYSIYFRIHFCTNQTSTSCLMTTIYS